MKVLKLNFVHLGVLREVDEFVLLPVESNGVLFPQFEVIDNTENYSGNFEAKRPKDGLSAEIIDLEKLSLKKAMELIDKSSYEELDPFLYFQSFRTEDLIKDPKKSEEIEKLLNKYLIFEENLTMNSREPDIRVKLVHMRFMSNLKNEYESKLADITISKEDYDSAINLLISNGIEVF